WWAFQPVADPPVPAVANAAWAASAVDCFVLAGLQARGLAPVAPADRRTLLRRVTFDLTGLPPTPEEVEAFLADPAPHASPPAAGGRGGVPARSGARRLRPGGGPAVGVAALRRARGPPLARRGALRRHRRRQFRLSHPADVPLPQLGDRGVQPGPALRRVPPPT